MYYASLMIVNALCIAINIDIARKTRSGSLRNAAIVTATLSALLLGVNGLLLYVGQP